MRLTQLSGASPVPPTVGISSEHLAQPNRYASPFLHPRAVGHCDCVAANRTTSVINCNFGEESACALSRRPFGHATLRFLKSWIDFCTAVPLGICRSAFTSEELPGELSLHGVREPRQAQRDFRRRPGSPAPRLGFKEFPLDRFGTQKPEFLAVIERQGVHKMTRLTRNATTSVRKGAHVRNGRGGIVFRQVPRTSKAFREAFSVEDVRLHRPRWQQYLQLSLHPQGYATP